MRTVWESKSFFDVNEDNGFLNFQTSLNFLQNKIKSFFFFFYILMYMYIVIIDANVFLYKEILEVFVY